MNNTNFPTNKEELMSLIDTKDELDLKAYKIAEARSICALYDDRLEVDYGQDSINVSTEGIWSDGSHDWESASFPTEYVFLPIDEAVKLATADREAEIKANEEYKIKQKELDARKKEEADRLEYERLKAKYGE